MDEKDNPGMEEEQTEEEGAKETLPEPQYAKTSTGLEENVAGLLCYVFGLITGVIFLVLEKENRFVRFHALQSIFISATLLVLNVFFTVIPVFGWILNLIVAPIGFVLWIILMVKAYQGQWFKLPVLGDLAEKKTN